MSVARASKLASELRGDLAGMTEALARFAEQEFPKVEPVQPRVAVLIPCFNEETAVSTVVADFRKILPSAEIFVYDNNSSDRTSAVAQEAGGAGAPRAPPGQGSCGQADVRRHRRRRLHPGRWRRDLRCLERAAHDREVVVRSSRHGRRPLCRSG